MSLKKLVDTLSVEAFFQSASKPVKPEDQSSDGWISVHTISEAQEKSKQWCLQVDFARCITQIQKRRYNPWKPCKRRVCKHPLRRSNGHFFCFGLFFKVGACVSRANSKLEPCRGTVDG